MKPEVISALAGFPETMRETAQALVSLVNETASSLPGVGQLEDSLKWGEPSFAPKRKNVGSSVRIAARRDGRIAMNFICHTGLVERFREIYSSKLEFEGNRTIVVDPEKPVQREEIGHCVAMALTYHLGKR
jgi:hypothetical protein